MHLRNALEMVQHSSDSKVLKNKHRRIEIWSSFFELTDKWIGYAGAVVLSEALKTNTTLCTIYLGG